MSSEIKPHRSGRVAILPLVVLAIVVIAGLVWPLTRVGFADNVTTCDDAPFQDARRKTLSSQANQKWAEAKSAWTEVLKKIPAGEGCAAYREEAKRNLEAVDKQITPSDDATNAKRLPEQEKDRRTTSPKEIPPKKLTEYYPKGRTVESWAAFNVQGKGTNKNWLYHAETNFAYQYRVVAKTTVTEVKGSRITFEIHFADIHQVRADSHTTLQLAEPESPLTKLFFDQADKWLKEVPAYRVFRIVQGIDRNLKQTLTFINNTFLKLGDDSDLELVTRIDQFSGAKVQVEYASGIGVTDIRVLEGKKFSPGDLENLAYSLSMAMDYFVGQVAEAKVGEKRKIRAEDVMGMMVIGYDVTASGQIGLEKTADADEKNSLPAKLKLNDGVINVTGRDNNGKRTGDIRPKSGIVEFQPQQRLVTKANMEWEAEMNWTTPSHLLFGTENMRNIKATSYYEATVPK